MTAGEREARLVAAAQAFVAATRGGTLEAFIPWQDLRDALSVYPLQVVDQRGRRFDLLRRQFAMPQWRTDTEAGRFR